MKRFLSALVIGGILLLPGCCCEEMCNGGNGNGKPAKAKVAPKKSAKKAKAVKKTTAAKKGKKNSKGKKHAYGQTLEQERWREAPDASDNLV